MRGCSVAGRPLQALIVALALALIGVLTACAPGAGNLLSQPPASAPQVEMIGFKPGTSYAVALQGVTDLGLQPTDNCYPADRQWHPMGQQDGFADTSALLVAATPLAPQDWLTRVRSLPSFSSAQADVPTNCPAIPAPVPTSTVPAPAEAAITFASTTTYDTALAEMTNLGLRLANPCYEAALNAGDHPAWQPMGQASAFANGQTLIVASTLLAPGDWLKRAQALPDVRAIQTPVVLSCPRY